MLYDPQQGPDSRVHAGTGLLPVAHRRHVNPDRLGERFLRHAKLAADRAHVWRRTERRQGCTGVLAVLNLVPADVFLRRGRNPSSVR